MSKLSRNQSRAYRRACGFFAGDLQALTGELKMSNLTGREVRDAAHYLVQDFRAWRPTLTAAQDAQFTQAETILAEQEAATGSGSVSPQQVGILQTKLHAPPFSGLAKTVAVICRHGPR